VKPFLVTLNYHKEVHKIRTSANTPEKAKQNAITRLAKKLGVTRFIVNYHVHEGDKIIIKEIRNDSAK